MHGLPANTAWIDVAAPFKAAPLAVHVAHCISIRYTDRAAALQTMAEQIAVQYARAPGHYLAFFSSDDTYRYPGLQKVVQAAGRVIRTPEDQGTLLWLDQRFARAEVQRLLPVCMS